MDQEKVQLEMRLSAIEFLLARLYVATLKTTGLPTAALCASLDRFVADASNEVFLGLEPSLADLANTEWTTAISALVRSIKEILAKPQTAAIPSSRSSSR